MTMHSIRWNGGVEVTPSAEELLTALDRWPRYLHSVEWGLHDVVQAHITVATVEAVWPVDVALMRLGADHVSRGEWAIDADTLWLADGPTLCVVDDEGMPLLRTIILAADDVGGILRAYQSNGAAWLAEWGATALEHVREYDVVRAWVDAGGPKWASVPEHIGRMVEQIQREADE